MRRRFALVVASSVSAILMDAGVAVSQPASVEYQVKAAFLFNFAKFVEWPRQAFARTDSPLTICLAGDPFDGAVDRIVQGEVLDGRLLRVRRAESRRRFAQLPNHLCRAQRGSQVGRDDQCRHECSGSDSG